jgi:hypothetical protein
VGKGGNELLTDGGLLDKFLAKDHALVAPFETFFDDGAGLADHGAGHHEAFVVEV